MTPPLQTQQEIAAAPPGDAAPAPIPSSPLGDPLWRPTSMIRLRRPLNEARGAMKHAGITHSMRGENCLLRRYRRPRDPQTPLQVRRRATLGEISRHWHTLPAKDRAAWQAYAEQYLNSRMPYCKPGNLGQDAWTSAQFYRLGIGFDYGEAAPATPPPAGRITAIEELPPLTPGSFRFRVTHDLDSPAGLFLLFQLTRPLASPRRRKAKDNAFIRAATADADSFLPLAISGAVYEIAQPSVEIPTGAPYAVRVRMVSADGLPGEPTTAYRMRV